MDNAKQFAYFPVARRSRASTTSRTARISVKFKTVAGDSDRARASSSTSSRTATGSRIRYNDTENNVALWEFHNGIRRIGEARRREAEVHARSRRVARAEDDGRRRRLQGLLDGSLALEYTLGSEPGPGRNGAPPNPDLFPDNNPVLRPPVERQVGLWSKTDSTSYFKDYVVSPK